MSTQLRSYKDYFIESRNNYVGKKPDLDYFYKKGILNLDTTNFPKLYSENIEELSKIVGEYFSKTTPTDNPKLIKYEEFNKIITQVSNISDIIVPYLEDNLYGCHLYVDKVYAWRNVSHNILEDSWLWHFDNNPNEIYKVMIYLSNVNTRNSPFQYLSNNKGFGKVIESTRCGIDKWKTIGSRISNSDLEKFIDEGYKINSMIGKKGSATVFNNSLVHRATIPEKNNYRDALVIRVKPTINKIDYISNRYTTSWEKDGAVNKNPNIIGD